MKESFPKNLILLQLLTIMLFVGSLEARIVFSDYITYNYESDRYISKKLYNFSNITDIKQRKKLFIDYMSLIIDTENKEIMNNRLRLLELKEKQELAQNEFEFVNNIEKAYLCKVSESQTEINWTELLNRVDEVPRELAITQAAIESGWGTSGFAQKGNNLFGHWTYKVGTGLVPKDRKIGLRHEIAVFDSVNDSVRKYLFNLNTNNAYKKLRVTRAVLRANNVELRGDILSHGLKSYSETGNHYIRMINWMMSDILKIIES